VATFTTEWLILHFQQNETFFSVIKVYITLSFYHDIAICGEITAFLELINEACLQNASLRWRRRHSGKSGKHERA
jgi:hypothetical protein